MREKGLHGEQWIVEDVRRYMEIYICQTLDEVKILNITNIVIGD